MHGLPNETVPDSARIGTARLALLGVAFVTVWLAIAAPADPLHTFPATPQFFLHVLALAVQ